MDKKHLLESELDELHATSSKGTKEQRDRISRLEVLQFAQAAKTDAIEKELKVPLPSSSFFSKYML